VEALRERGIPTIAHVRPDSPRLAEWRERFEGLGAETDATAWEPAALAESLRSRRPGLVFALLGTTRARSARVGWSATEGYARVDEGLTVMLLDAVRAAGLRPRVVYLSSVGVREGTRNAYLAARRRTEEALRRSGLDHVIARPSVITGPDRDDGRSAERVAGLVADGLLAAAGLFGARRVRDRYRSTTNHELARALVRLALDPDAGGKTVHSEGLRDG
jgi:nucleoside-diphosphate-sugar epimerase